ncbi:MAG TPA: DNA polymerase ligase N-terminal domain-containing protein, partial [Gemmatimonadaceae bacterium]|nr:DNA polymerase ligase N-terminal domain-containing protein [Gemmatimonadaceae bacterium]
MPQSGTRSGTRSGTPSGRRDALRTYRRKRDFHVTHEPRGAAPPARGAAHALEFVIQKHAASHLHFDLRLEVDGAMKSWAVPKGPSRDPSVKRLAMQVEDHPMEYNTFEGTIPKGEYGGGTVMIWDRGTYEGEGGEAGMRAGLAKGRLTFTLHGDRLEGTWSLVRMKGDDSRSWLLIKQKDEFVETGDTFASEDSESVVTGRTMKQIAEISPMLATIGTAVPEGSDWVFEPKYDGVRVLAFASDDGVSLLSRNNIEKAPQFPEIAEALGALR